MNQNQIQQLTSHLSQALDQNYDVVNMEAVLSVISTLEGTTITKEQLEATRLAKYINQLRRRTKDESLAKRAKSLLKKWREMVGIQQTSNDSQSQQQLAQSSFKPTIGANISESNVSDSAINTLQFSSQPSASPSQHAISELHSIVDSSEPQYIAGSQQQHTNFSSLINHINVDNGEDSVSASVAGKPIKQQRPKFINEHSSNSVPNLAAANEASIVIDIVSDSDENSSTQLVQPKLAPTTTASALPAHPYPRPKKLKKEKKRKEKEGRPKPSLFNLKEDSAQQPRSVYRATNLTSIPVKEKKIAKTYPTDTEILSLSNSSVSSMLSGDAVFGNSQNKLRNTSADLTFTGRFKSASQLDAPSQDNPVLANGQETPSVDQPMRQNYIEYINTDSSTSGSRLSPFDELDSKQISQKSFDDASKQQMPISFASLKPNEKLEYHENSQVPKKRGRKKGSKGVDSIIAKESSLSQQIFFGSGVKKVKTTKELFNEIQSRKLSISAFNRGESSLPAANSSTLRNRGESRSLLARPTSSGSEASMHSPHTLEAYSANVSLSGTDKFSNRLGDAGNTDSDTITSEHSRDSIKSRLENKRTISLDSNSNSQRTLSAKNIESHHNDVTTQLMHLVHSLKSPLSVLDTEKLYQAQIVPCTCVIVEETPKSASGQTNSSHLENEAAGENQTNCVELERDSKDKEKQSLQTDGGSCDAAPVSMPPKPMRSIFDLDFDDEDDPLHSMIKSIAPPESNLKRASVHNDNDDTKSSTTATHSNEANSVDLQAVGDANEDPDASNMVMPEPVSVYTVHEDPDCIAKKVFHEQTNDVTNFHINALHNYYIPNINGNWNSDSSLVLESTISEFLHTLESYTVTDGSDVVPRYGSLTYERIKKDLSCIKLTQNFKAKCVKSCLPPFLGIAKCLPSCRLAAKRLKSETKALNTKLESCRTAEPSPLRVDVDVDEVVEVGTTTQDNNNEKQVQIHCSSDGSYYGGGVNNNTALSYNLLKLATEDSTDENFDKVVARRSSSSSSSSSGSNSSLKMTQNSINEKLRNQRNTEKQSESERNVERNRKKRRKAARGDDAKPRIKRIKIAINGSLATQRQISHMSSSEDEDEDRSEELSDTEPYQMGQTASEDEHGSYRSHSTTVDEDGVLENEDDNSNDEEYAIVQRPMGGGSNHIVLTIKKTPSKINSPVNSISAVSPSVAAAVPPEAETAKNTHLTNIDSNKSNYGNFLLEPTAHPNAEMDKPSNLSHTCLTSSLRCCYHQRRRRPSRRSNCKKENIDIELKHLFNNVDRSTQSGAKTHRRLFFANELRREDSTGRKERIINYSSSSSSCFSFDEESEHDGDQFQNSFANKLKLNIETDRGAVKDEDLREEEPYLPSSDDDSVDTELELELQLESELEVEAQDELPAHNNGMLSSFNSILAANCDDVRSTCYNNNNLSVIKSQCVIENTSSRVLEPTQEHTTGIRLDTTAATAVDDPNTSRIQEFKEWHQVLQLQSYNDEPLIVLPYVVLE